MNSKCVCAFVILMFWFKWINISTAQDDHAKVLDKLAKDFKNVLKGRKQYAVLYITNSDAINGEVEYKPMKKNVTPAVVFPWNDEMLEDNEYPYTYSAVTPDYDGKCFSKILKRNRKATIHTEDLALNLVFPVMKNWFISTYNVFEVTNVYLYSYYLPCADCKTIIQDFLESNSHIRLYIGFSKLLWSSKETETQIKTRKQELQNLLQNSGNFYDLGCNGNAKRRKRDLNKVCYLDGKRKQLSLMLNFSNGAVIVRLVGLPNGTLVLKDKKDNLVATTKVNNNDDNIVSFRNSYMNEGYYVIFNGEHNKLQMQTKPWRQCGFDWEGMNALPSHYDEVLVQLQIQDGSPFICLQSANFSVMQFDIVQLEGIYKNDSTIESNMAYVNQFNVSETESISRCYKFSRLTQDFSDGFRVKYIYCYSDNNCTYRGLYDNASPFWTPEYCFCGDCYHVEPVTVSACGNKGASAARILFLLYTLFQLILPYYLQ